MKNGRQEQFFLRFFGWRRKLLQKKNAANVFRKMIIFAGKQLHMPGVTAVTAAVREVM